MAIDSNHYGTFFPMSTHYRLVFCTCPDDDTAARLAQGMVEARLAACVNILPNIRSVYSWKGKLESDDEVLLLIKTRQDRIDDLEQFILSHHPYELPEIVSVSIEQGQQKYLQWIGAWLDSTD